MTRPVPLYDGDGLIRVLEPTPLSTDDIEHADYLKEHLDGDLLIISQNADRLSRLEAFASTVSTVSEIVTSHNDTATAEQFTDHELAVAADRTFDTIFYSKERTQWFTRPKDFHRLTPHLAVGGTLLSKSKWVPDSDRLQLQGITIADGLSFTNPSAYLRFTKTQANLSAYRADGSGSAPTGDGGESAATRALSCSTGDESRHSPAGTVPTHEQRTARRQLASQLESQYPNDARQTEYTPGWSWHTPLQDRVASKIATIDRPVANLCCGTSDLGDIRVDLLREWTDTSDPDDPVDRPTAATVQADAMRAPLKSNSVAGAVTDPPWKVDPATRVRLFSEAVRVVEKGGTIVMNAWWLPHHPYATVTDIRPVVANVTDTSIGGMGGLSLMATYRVEGQPNHEACEYALADHFERVDADLDALAAYRDWGRAAAPQQAPENDPRIIGRSLECEVCDASRRYIPQTFRDRLLYECRVCGFRYRADELLA